MGAARARPTRSRFFDSEGACTCREAARRAGARRRRRSSGAATPSNLGERRVAEAASQAFDTTATRRSPTLERLDAMGRGGARAGLPVAFGMTTNGPDCHALPISSASSLALAPGRAGYVPLQHRSDSELFGGGLLPGQIPVRDALAALARCSRIPARSRSARISSTTGSSSSATASICGPSTTRCSISYVLDAGKGGHGLDELSRRHLGHAPAALSDVTGTGRDAVELRQGRDRQGDAPTPPRTPT